MMVPASRILNGLTKLLRGVLHAAYGGRIMRSVFVLIERRGEA
jgi:hypothetical protein